MKRLIAGDIGGTKTLLRAIDEDGQITAQQRYDSGSFRSFDDLLALFLQHVPGRITAASFAIAGPVLSGRAELTNLGWVMQEDELRRKFGIQHVALINDFYGVALGVPILDPATDLLPIYDVPRVPHAPMAILGAGTGLGEAFVVFEGGRWVVIPSEGGHRDFAPQDEEQARLFLTLRERYGGHVSWERLVSGMGLENVYEFLTGREETPQQIAALAASGDRQAVRTFHMFVDMYGAEAGNLALTVLARGGVFLAGGIAAKTRSFFTDGRFVEAYLRKGRFRDLLETMPVYLILNEQVGLLGAVEQARRIIG